MKFEIDRIILFSKDNQTRALKLRPGVNIITGESQKGKSAIIEIIEPSEQTQKNR